MQISELLCVCVCVCALLCTSVVHNTTQNSSNYFPSNPPNLQTIIIAQTPLVRKRGQFLYQDIVDQTLILNFGVSSMVLISFAVLYFLWLSRCSEFENCN